MVQSVTSPQPCSVALGRTSSPRRGEIVAVFGPPKPPRRRRNNHSPPPRPPKHPGLMDTTRPDGLREPPPRSSSTTSSLTSSSSGLPQNSLQDKKTPKRRSWPFLLCDCLYVNNCRTYEDADKWSDHPLFITNKFTSVAHCMLWFQHWTEPSFIYLITASVSFTNIIRLVKSFQPAHRSLACVLAVVSESRHVLSWCDGALWTLLADGYTEVVNTVSDIRKVVLRGLLNGVGRCVVPGCCKHPAERDYFPGRYWATCIHCLISHVVHLAVYVCINQIFIGRMYNCLTSEGVGSSPSIKFTNMWRQSYSIHMFDHSQGRNVMGNVLFLCEYHSTAQIAFCSTAVSSVF